MKRIFCVLLALLTCFVLICLPVAAAGEKTALTVTASSSSVVYGKETGGEFGVAVGIALGSGEPGLASYVVTVTWDPELLEPVAAYGSESGCWFDDHYGMGLTMVTDTGHSVNAKRVSKGSLTVSSGSADNRAVSSGTLFVIGFRLLSDKADSTSVTASFGSSAVSPAESLSHASSAITSVNPDAFRVLKLNGGTKDLPGDVNGDSRTNALDYMLIKSHVKSFYQLTAGQKARSDMNEDCAIDSLDYTILKARVLGTAAMR